MRKQPTVSVIIPVYNAAMFLEDCIRSLEGQTLAGMELIFVNDGSQDRSGEILEKAAARNPAARVISFPENRGVSAARNAGLEAARGEFVGFCDGDDWVEPQMYAELYRACMLRSADISFCRVFKDRPSGRENVPLGIPDSSEFDYGSIRSRLVPQMLALKVDGDGLPLSGYTPRNLFRRVILQGLRFREEIHYAEDLVFIVEAMLRCRKAVAVDFAYYHYRFHEGSVTKRYSAYIPDSFDRSNQELERLVGGFDECRSRMMVRRRKMAVDVVRNYCAVDSPWSMEERIRLSREYMNRADVRSAFSGLRLTSLSPRTAIRLGLVKYRLAALACWLFSKVFRNHL